MKTHVLCKKPCDVQLNVAELCSLIAVAKGNNVFMGGAVDTFSTADERGESNHQFMEPVVVHADFSNEFDVDGACVRSRGDDSC